MLRLFISGIVWHYTKAYKEIFELSRDFLWFIFHLFSIKDLSKTLFYPWQRLGERYRGGFHPGEWFSSVAINLLMRLVGFIARIFVIITGLVCALIVLVVSVLFLVLWTVIPFFMVFLFITALKFIFSSNLGNL